MDMRYSQPPPTGEDVSSRAGNGFLHQKVSPARSSGEIRRFREGENTSRSRHHVAVMASTQVNKEQKTDDDGGGGGGSAPTTLAHVLLILKFLPRKFFHNLVSFTSVPQTSRLLTTCTELYNAEEVILQRLPTVCDMRSNCVREGNKFKLFHAMVATPNSRWLEWLDTSGVEKLILPSKVTDEEMLIMFGVSFKLIPMIIKLGAMTTLLRKARTLRYSVKGESVDVESKTAEDLIALGALILVTEQDQVIEGMDVVWKRGTGLFTAEDLINYPELYPEEEPPMEAGTFVATTVVEKNQTYEYDKDSVKLPEQGYAMIMNGNGDNDPYGTFDDHVRTNGCFYRYGTFPQLPKIPKIPKQSESGKRFSELRTLDLKGDHWGCRNITDASLREVARRCSNLQKLDLEFCLNITDGSVSEVARECSNLQSLNLRLCRNITDASIFEVARRCSNLQSLDLFCCRNITDASVMEVARRCSNLQTLNLNYCNNITDASVSEVATRCSNLQTLNLIGCSNITSACKKALRQSYPKPCPKIRL